MSLLLRIRWAPLHIGGQIKVCTKACNFKNTKVNKNVQVYSREPICEYDRLGGLNTRYLFLTVLEAGNPRSRC